jgi:hypothetical protein
MNIMFRNCSLMYKPANLVTNGELVAGFVKSEFMN